jgi:RNA polymerase sigma-70 factor (ECF subfamily)
VDVRGTESATPELANCMSAPAADFQTVLDRFERPLLAFARHQGADDETARDAVQETFLRFIRKSPSGDLESLAPWLFTVCRNCLSDFHRKSSRLVAMDTETSLAAAPDETAAPDAALASKDDAGLLRMLVGGLPDRERELIRLKFESGLSYKDIAAVTGLSVSNVGYLLHHAVQTLRGQFHATV